MESPVIYIRTDQELSKVCRQLRSSESCAIDTEFVWDRTYAPQVGLIQIAGDSTCALIDPLTISDLSPLRDLLADADIDKVLHAATMDLKVLKDVTGVIPSPVFDTQIAAALLGYGNQTSYSFLAEQFAGVIVDKSETYTDWLQRPLTDKQIKYAANDVVHLRKVHEQLRSELQKRGRLDWAVEEFRRAVDPENYKETDPYDLYKSVKRSGSLDPVGLAVLRELAAWRDTRARERNVRPHAIIRDESLVELARRQPSTVASLKEIRGIDGRLVGRCGQEILHRISAGLMVPIENMPVPAERVRANPGTLAAADLLWALVITKATAHEVSPELLSSRAEIRRLVEDWPDLNGNIPEVLKGWRREIVGDDLLRMLEGNCSLALNGTSGICVIDLTPST